VSVAVNISPRQLHHVDLVRHVVEALDGVGLEASLLELEITESSAMQNPEATIQTLNALKSLGVRVSIDDFGMGYSSLSQLQRLPIDTLKIDRSFVRDISTDPGDAAIATAVITLAHSLRLKVVAEGVETPEQLAFLNERKCDRVQGYLLSQPIPDDRCAELLARHDAGRWRAGSGGRGPDDTSGSG
jgi:EAL domain-containing protein (putative c-di-GMP-specific phosphodiesterase class I)